MRAVRGVVNITCNVSLLSYLHHHLILTVSSPYPPYHYLILAMSSQISRILFPTLWPDLRILHQFRLTDSVT